MKDNRELIDKEAEEVLNKEKAKKVDEIKQFTNNTFKTKEGIKTLVWLAERCGYNKLSVDVTSTEITYLNEGKKFVFLIILQGLNKETTLDFQKELLTNRE